MESQQPTNNDNKSQFSTTLSTKVQQLQQQQQQGDNMKTKETIDYHTNPSSSAASSTSQLLEDNNNMNNETNKINNNNNSIPQHLTIDIPQLHNHNNRMNKKIMSKRREGYPLTGNVDIIGILNNNNNNKDDSSITSIDPSDLFVKQIPTINLNNTHISNRNRPPPSPVLRSSTPPPPAASQAQGKKSKYIKKNGSINNSIHDDDSNEDNIPTIEINILPNGSSLSLNGGGRSLASNSINQLNDDKNIPSSPSSMYKNVIGFSNSAPVSPLTPKGESARKLPRRLSSSDRLLKLLDGMNNRKRTSSFDINTYRDQNYVHENDDDDDDDDNDSTYGYNNNVAAIPRNKIVRIPSSRSYDTEPMSNIHYDDLDGIHVRSGVLVGNNDSFSAFSPISALSSSYYKTPSKQYYDYSTLPQPVQEFNDRKRTPGKANNGEPAIYAQSFILALAFFAVWSQQNLMAPNLTQMAEYFNFSPEQRDLYLGANIALATGVLSLPVSGALGFLADVVSSRINLFAGTVCCGGIAAICTGLSETYTQIYFSRFLSGGCMAGSVVIAFSILGDLFDAKDRNAASSGLTAMMGAGILFGQVFAGTVGNVYNWKVPFYVSGVASILTSMMCVYFVREPVRGGKEKVLQEMLASGTKYDRKLTFEGFIHAMTKNKTNILLMIQGFFTNVPWGIIFTFLNDYLSQEQGLSVPASTFLVLMFGIGSAAGGVCGGFIGGLCIRVNRVLLPIFMSISTLLGVLPFLGLLDWNLSGPGFIGIFLCLAGGVIANLPSVNVRPCILNVNPPETRGAAMTANNLMINVARGAGPSLITLSQSFFGVSRQYSFNVTLIVFWSISALILVILATTLPSDQDKMESELASYAQSKKQSTSTTPMTYYDDTDGFKMLDDNVSFGGDESIVSIEDRMSSFDAAAARESWYFIGGALREIGQLAAHRDTHDDADEGWGAPNVTLRDSRQIGQFMGESETLL